VVILIEKSPFFDCPKYKKCNVNNCPLDKKYPYMIIDHTDSSQKCDLEKQVRCKIALQYPGILPYAGYTVKEWTARKVWNGMDQETRKNRLIQANENIKAITKRKND
jgi:hypothetical protein